MPVYEYECKKCAKRFEVIRGFNETGGGVCPTCGREGQRIFYAPPLLFKGSGFYITESRKKAGQTEEGAAPAGDKDKTPAKSALEKAEKPEKSSLKLKTEADKPS